MKEFWTALLAIFRFLSKVFFVPWSFNQGKLDFINFEDLVLAFTVQASDLVLLIYSKFSFLETFDD